MAKSATLGNTADAVTDPQYEYIPELRKQLKQEGFSRIPDPSTLHRMAVERRIRSARVELGHRLMVSGTDVRNALTPVPL